MSRPTALLTRAPHHARPALPVLGAVALARMRVHELCGRSRRTLAAWVAGAAQAAGPGPVIWVAPAWEKDAVFAPGLAGVCAPERFLFIHPRRPEDVLWTLEETLRAGAAPLVVGDLPGLPGLTQVRRLHLAAEAGGEIAGELGGGTGAAPPLGLLLTPGPEGGAPGVESRWRLEPAHEPSAAGWRLSRLRARTAPRRDWLVRQGETGPELAPPPTGDHAAAPAARAAG